MLTIFFKHDQSRPLSELNAQLERQGFYKAFPPAGVGVVSWYVMMEMDRSSRCGCRRPAYARSHRILESTASGTYRTEFYPTYDYKAVGIAAHGEGPIAFCEIAGRRDGRCIRPRGYAGIVRAMVFHSPSP